MFYELKYKLLALKGLFFVFQYIPFKKFKSYMFYPKEMQNRQKTFCFQLKKVCKRRAILAKTEKQNVTKHSQK